MFDHLSSSAYLVLADGTVFSGELFGHHGLVVGEVVFNTGMTGYQEILTDPSYSGQLVSFTYPELGNTGVNSYDQEAQSTHALGVIARELAPSPSNWRCEGRLEDWMEDNGVVGIRGVDTRALVRHLREVGTINGVISNDLFTPSELLTELYQAPSMLNLNLADKVSTKSSYLWDNDCEVFFDKRLHSSPEIKYRVAAIDFGIKRSILNRLVAHGCEVNVLPSNADINEVMKYNPEGVFFSNGPGDPSAVKNGISLASQLLEMADLPLFGICLGHQILGIALGGRTFKLSYGHRGLNHPCGSSTQVEITSQNHGFALDACSLNRDNLEVTHFNLNDSTVAAFRHRNRPVFGVQYHPEASPGPHDADHHFGRFVALMSDRR